MFNNVVLDVFIGLIFIFLLYSLLATVLQEMIASRFGLRARMLQKAMRRMLQDEDNDVKKENEEKRLKGANGLWNYLGSMWIDLQHFFKPFSSAHSLLYKFYSHPTIKYLGEGKLFRKPSYLHAHNFSQTMIHLLRGDGYDGRNQTESELIAAELFEKDSEGNPVKSRLVIDEQTRKQLKLLFADARQDSVQFKHKLEDWFEETMERVTGWYKKQSQVLLIIIGFVLAWVFNVDTIAIAKILMKDKAAREQIVQMAIAKQKDYAGITDSVRKITTLRTERKNGDSLSVSTVDTITAGKGTDKYLDSTYRMLSSDAASVQGILGLNGTVKIADSSYYKNLENYFDRAIGGLTKEMDSIKKNEIGDTSEATGTGTAKILQKRDSLLMADTAKRNILLAFKKTALDDCAKEIVRRSPFQGNGGIVFLGWLITALAISLGAPFWFDMLNKVIKLRESGPKVTNKSAIDAPTDGLGVRSTIRDKNNNEIKG